jgi:hypothetical protein
MSPKPLVREFESLVQFGNVPLVVPPLVHYLGPAWYLFVVPLELVQVMLGNVVVLVDCPLPAPCLLPVRAYSSSVCSLQRHSQNEDITLYYYILHCITTNQKK